MDTLKIANIRLIRLKGTREERAIKHGNFIASLSTSERKGLAYTPLSKKNQTLINRVGDSIPGFGILMGALYEAFVLQRYLSLPKEYRRRLYPFAKASKLPLKTIWTTLYQPDLLMVLAASVKERVRNRFLSGLPGCSTGIISTPNQALYFLRNLDYPAASYWEKNACVFYHEPSEPESQNYLSVSSLGIDTAGLTGLNESGIAFSLHAHFSKKVRLRGVPIFFLGEAILEKAKTLDEAVEICRQFKPIGSWAINLSSAKENKSLTVEISCGSIAVIGESKPSQLAHSNHFLNEAYQKSELHLSGSFFEDCQSRKDLIEKKLAEFSDSDPIHSSIEILASHVDPTTGQIRSFGNTVSVVTTIQSSIFDFKNACLYLSNRNETPTGLGPYLKLPFRFSEALEIKTSEFVSASKAYPENFLKALHAYYQAYVSWHVNREDSTVPLGFLVQATAATPQDPHLQLQRAYFELLHLNSEAALVSLEKALKEELSPHLRQVALYFKGACYDLQKKRSDALRCYETILSAPFVDSHLGAKVKARLKRPFQARFCKKIEPDLQFAEPIDYR